MDYEKYVEKLQNFTREELIAEILSLKDLNYMLSLNYFHQEETKQELRKNYSQLLQLVKDHYSKFIQEELGLDIKYSIFLKEQELSFQKEKKKYLDNKKV